MRKKLGYMAVTAALFAVVGGLAIAQAATTITAPETIVLLTHGGKTVSVDVGKKGTSPGDTRMTSSPLYDETDTTQVGTAHYQCTVQPGKGWELCSASLIITDRGELVSSGTIHWTADASSFPMPMTGGTDEFANVRGSGLIEVVDNDTFKYTLNLLP